MYECFVFVYVNVPRTYLLFLERVSGPLELGLLGTFAWVLGTEPLPFARAASALNH